MKLPRAHHLSTEELAGQMLMPAVRVDFLNRRSPELRRLVRLVEKYWLGGIILFGGHPLDVRQLVEKLQEAAPYPLLIAADLEQGVGGLLQHGTLFPHALAWGATNDQELIRQAASVIAAEARALGINTCLAPVLDLVNNPRNPIINIRGFHADPERVAEIGACFARANQEQGIVCVAKHFPGHSRASQDSHSMLPTLRARFTGLTKTDLHPFKRLIEEGIHGLMTAHLQFSDHPLPTTLRSDILQDYLREELQFGGLLFSDALDMKAIAGRHRLAEQARLGILAGLDIFLMPPNLPLFFHILRDLTESDPELRRRMEQSVDRIFRIKKWLHRHQPQIPHPGRVYKILEHPNHIGTARKLAEKSLTCLHKADNFPLDARKVRRCLHLVHTDYPVVDPPLPVLEEELRRFFDEVDTLVNPDARQLKNAPWERIDLVVVSFVSQTLPGHRSRFHWRRITTSLDFTGFFEEPIVGFSFGNPFPLKIYHRLKDFTAFFLAYSDSPASQTAAFKALISAIPVTGTLPIRLPGVSGSQEVPTRRYCLEETEPAKKPDETLDQQVEELIVPSENSQARLLIARQGTIVYQRHYGIETSGTSGRRGSSEALFPLNSLSEFLVAFPALLHLKEREFLRFEQPLAELFPLFPESRLAELPLADFLALPVREESSLPPNDGEAVREMLRNWSSDAPELPRELKYFLEAEIITQVSGLSEAEYLRDYFYRPMGLTGLDFKTSDLLSNQTPDPAAVWRVRLHEALHGGPVDPLEPENTPLQLLGTAREVAALVQLFLNRGIYNGKRFLRAATVDWAFNHLFTRPDFQGLLGKQKGLPERSTLILAPNGSFLYFEPDNQDLVILLNKKRPVQGETLEYWEGLKRLLEFIPKRF